MRGFLVFAALVAVVIIILLASAPRQTRREAVMDSDTMAAAAEPASRRPDVWTPPAGWAHRLPPVVDQIYRRAAWCEMTTRREGRWFDDRDFLRGPGQGPLRPAARACR